MTVAYPEREKLIVRSYAGIILLLVVAIISATLHSPGEGVLLLPIFVILLVPAFVIGINLIRPTTSGTLHPTLILVYTAPWAALLSRYGNLFHKTVAVLGACALLALLIPEVRASFRKRSPEVNS